MPAIRHEGAVMLVRDRPELVLDLLARAGVWSPLESVAGRALGRRDALKTVVAARGIELSKAGLERIDQCGDAALVERWVARAAKATTEDEIFADD